MATRADDRFATAVDFARALQRVEMELSYAPTAIDVPNLTILERVHDVESADSADATRIRSVATVQAQPLLPPAPGVEQPGADSTVIRRMPAVQPHGQAGTPPESTEHTVIRARPVEEAPQPIPADGPAPRRKLWPILAGAAGVLVIGSAVAASLVFAPDEPDPAPTTTASPDVLTLGVPTPAPVAVTPSADGTQVTFEWENLEPLSGDMFAWNRSDGPNRSAKTPTDDGMITIEGVDSNTQVCVEVFIVRSNGKMSTEPLEMCSK